MRICVELRRLEGQAPPRGTELAAVLLDRCRVAEPEGGLAQERAPVVALSANGDLHAVNAGPGHALIRCRVPVERIPDDLVLAPGKDLRGALGLSDDYRNGFERVRVTFKVQGDAPADKLRELVRRAQQRSAVFDIVSHGVPVTVSAMVDEPMEISANGSAD
jgi:hypothetical protein